MTKNLSAIKRVQISQRNNLRNRVYKSTIKTIVKKSLNQMKSLEMDSYKKAVKYVSQAYSVIDKAVKRKVIPKNHASRKKSMLLSNLKNMKTKFDLK